MSNLKPALEYVARGWWVFPLPPGDKAPYPGSHGWKDATVDVMQVMKWWEEEPDANIGIWCGASGLVVLDFDWRNGGQVAWDDWGKDLDTLTVTTPGGKHLYFTEYNWDKLAPVIAKGVDVRAGDKYVIAPPSRTYDVYRWVNEHAAVNQLPEHLHASARVDSHKGQPAGVSVTARDGGGDRPGDVLARTMEWSDILDPHGWSYLYSGEDGTDYWTRPGKHVGVSASTGYGDHDLLYVFTSSIPELDASTGYSKFTAYTLLNHGGDFSAAATQLASEQKNQKVMVTVDTATDLSTDSHRRAFVSGTWVGDCSDLFELQTDAPVEYHEAAALIGLSVASQGVRGRLAPFPDGLATNLYAILCGSTTVSRKSTVQGLILNILTAAFPFAKLPDKETPEAFIQTLADRSGVATVWAPDELGISLAEMYARDYMAQLEGVLLSVYGGSDYTYHRASGNPIVVRNPHLSILGASTPEALARSGTSALTSGLLPRFGVVFPSTFPEPRPVAENAPDTKGLRDNLVTRIRDIQKFCVANPEVTFSREALTVLNREEVTLGKDSASARLPVMLYKVSMLSAVADHRTVVSEDDAEASAIVINRWAGGVNNLKPFLFGKKADKEFEDDVLRAYGFMAGCSTPRSVIARQMRLSESKLNNIERTLQDWAYIRVDTQDGVRTWVTE